MVGLKIKSTSGPDKHTESTIKNHYAEPYRKWNSGVSDRGDSFVQQKTVESLPCLLDGLHPKARIHDCWIHINPPKKDFEVKTVPDIY